MCIWLIRNHTRKIGSNSPMETSLPLTTASYSKSERRSKSKNVHSTSKSSVVLAFLSCLAWLYVAGRFVFLLLFFYKWTRLTGWAIFIFYVLVFDDHPLNPPLHYPFWCQFVARRREQKAAGKSVEKELWSGLISVNMGKEVVVSVSFSFSVLS